MQYVLLAPWLAHSVHKFMTGKPEDRDMFNFLIIPSLLMRLLHAQLWITLSRMKTANSKHSIVDKSLDFEQVDRERNWYSFPSSSSSSSLLFCRIRHKV